MTNSGEREQRLADAPPEHLAHRTDDVGCAFCGQWVTLVCVDGVHMVWRERADRVSVAGRDDDVSVREAIIAVYEHCYTGDRESPRRTAALEAGWRAYVRAARGAVAERKPHE